MEESPPSETGSRLAGQEIVHFSSNPAFNYCVHENYFTKSRPPFGTLRAVTFLILSYSVCTYPNIFLSGFQIKLISSHPDM
jgi:hypothetical protein